MIERLFKNFRKRLKRTNKDTLDDQLSNSSVPDEVSSEDAPSYEVANANRTLVIWEPPVAERLANESEAERLQRQIQELDEQLLGLEQGILQMKQKLDEKFPELVGELYALRAQLEEEFLRLTEGQRNEEFINENERDENGLTPEEQAELNRIEAEVKGESAESRKRREEYEAKIIAEGTKIYRQIAMRTHPDRTSNKAFHAIFKEAKDAYENKMWGRLHELWAIIGPKTGKNLSGLFEALLSRLGALREELRKKEQALVAIKSDKDFGMYRDYQVPAYRSLVEAHYKTLLEFNIRQTKQVLASMGAQDYESFLRTEVPKDIVEDMTQPSSSSHNEQPRKSPQARAADRYFKTHSVLNEKVDQELDSPWVDED